MLPYRAENQIGADMPFQRGSRNLLHVLFRNGSILPSKI